MQVTNDTKDSNLETLSIVIGFAVWYLFSFWWGVIAFAIALSYFKNSRQNKTDD